MWTDVQTADSVEEMPRLRATPLTIVSPVPVWWSWWVRFTWRYARIDKRLAGRLHDLSFIRVAHWALIKRWPGRRSLLFLTSFDGAPEPYIDAFCRVVTGRIRGLYWGADGFPNARRATAVTEYIEAHAHPNAHRFRAFPDASTTTIAGALELHRRVRAFSSDARELDDAAFAAAWRRFAAEVQEWL